MKQNGLMPFCFSIDRRLCLRDYSIAFGNVWFGANVNEKMGYFFSW
ncbi:hypothetical protein VIC_004084 [Vibrio coralliilyticus ATCC BAA-450]|nr:hypothetical protein VIC_004084 [Vibrio coralliilyticus ATCC BAA-450]